MDTKLQNCLDSFEEFKSPMGVQWALPVQYLLSKVQFLILE